jgi:hypothetical protein
VLRDAAQAGGGGERMPQFFSINDAMDDEVRKTASFF